MASAIAKASIFFPFKSSPQKWIILLLIIARVSDPVNKQANSLIERAYANIVRRIEGQREKLKARRFSFPESGRLGS
jgi:hypothetical protein